MQYTLCDNGYNDNGSDSEIINKRRCRPSAGIVCGRPLSYAYSPPALLSPNTNLNSDRGVFEVKIGRPVTPALGNVHTCVTVCGFLHFLFSSYEPVRSMILYVRVCVHCRY